MFTLHHSLKNIQLTWGKLKLLLKHCFWSKVWILSHLYNQMSISQTSHSFTYLIQNMSLLLFSLCLHEVSCSSLTATFAIYMSYFRSFLYSQQLS